MARSAEECEMELHHRHSDLDTFGDLMMFDSPVAYSSLWFSLPVRSPRSGPIKEAKGWGKQRKLMPSFHDTFVFAPLLIQKR